MLKNAVSKLAMHIYYSIPDEVAIQRGRHLFDILAQLSGFLYMSCTNGHFRKEPTSTNKSI